MRRLILVLFISFFAFQQKLQAWNRTPPSALTPSPQLKISWCAKRETKTNALRIPKRMLNGQHVKEIPLRPLRASTRVDDLGFMRCLSETDLAVIQEQLGDVPPNVMSISSRTFHNSTVPVAIKCYPLGGGSMRRQRKSIRAFETFSSITRKSLTPFPTLYWLCNRHISKALSDLEREGYVKLLERRLQDYSQDSTNLHMCVAESHKLYAEERWNTLSNEDRHFILTESSSDGTTTNMLAMLRDSGVAGTDFRTNPTPSLKCLHAHYAFYRSSPSSSANAKEYSPSNITSLVPGSGESPPSPFLVGEWIHQLLLDIIPDKL